MIPAETPPTTVVSTSQATSDATSQATSHATSHATTDEQVHATSIAPLDEIIARQRAWFRSGATRPREARDRALAALRDAIVAFEEEIGRALADDLNKCAFEAYTSEIAFLYEEIRHARRHLRRWMKTRRVSTPLVHQPARSHVIRRPHGVSAIIAPWNYPFQLAVAPLVAAVAAGNCVVVKPSEFAPATAKVIAAVVERAFRPEHVACVTGGGEVASALAHAEVNHIFFTGSTAVGRKVMAAAAERLVPVTLELGGKSPAIVAPSARLSVAARRLVWGKFLNAGQTCVAPDYVVVHESVADQLVTALGEVVSEFFGADPAASDAYGRIIDDRHMSRLSALLDRQRRGAPPVTGGTVDTASRYIAPTIFDRVGWGDPLMEEEIFGPILPVLRYTDFDSLIEQLAARDNPLAAYLFTEDRSEMSRFEELLPFGGASINDTVVHLVNPDLPFGGSGPSGIGSYHGESGFLAFSHEAGVMRRGTLIDPPLKYPPYGKALALIRKVMRP